MADAQGRRLIGRPLSDGFMKERLYMPGDVTRRQRWSAAAAMALSAGALLCGYELMRSAAQSLYLAAYGAERLPIVMALGPVGTLLAIAGYARLLSAVGARRALLLTTLATAALVLACLAALRAGSRPAAGVLYVLREAYIVLLIEQIWAFLNSTLREEDGRLLNGPICGLASLGAIGGALLVRYGAERVGSVNLLWPVAVSLLLTGGLAWLAYTRGGEPRPAENEAGGRRGHLGIGLLMRDPRLRALALLIAATQAVSTVLDLHFSRWVATALPETDARTGWLGGFYAGLNASAACGQFVVAPLLLRWVSPRWIHIGIPLVHGVACAAAWGRPSLGTAAVAYGLFKTLDYSVFRAAKELVYIPLSFDARYRAKEWIDAFTYRFAKGAVSGILAVSAIPVAYPALALLALAGWLPLAARVTRPPEKTQHTA